MQNCPKCKVSVVGNKKCCPLCQNKLSGKGDFETESYPQISNSKYIDDFLLKIISFVAIVCITISISINFLIESSSMWSLFVVAAILSGWITAIVGISYRKKLLQNITNQLFLLTLLAVGWDYFTGWRGWSIDYVIPCSCTASLISMFALALVLKFPTTQYIFYLVISCVYRIVPIIFYKLELLNVILPSIICTASSIISISAIVIFEGKNIMTIVHRKFHI